MLVMSFYFIFSTGRYEEREPRNSRVDSSLTRAENARCPDFRLTRSLDLTREFVASTENGFALEEDFLKAKPK